MTSWCSGVKRNFWTSQGFRVDRTSEISDLFFYVSYFVSKNKGINFGNEDFDVCYENKNIWLDVR